MKLNTLHSLQQEEHEKIITIMLDEHNKNNKYKIEDSLNLKKLAKELPLN